MKNLKAIIFSILVIVTAAIVTWRALCFEHPDILDIGKFIILALTLIVLVWYAHDTNTIARVAQERWMREGVLSTSYDIEITDKKGQAGHTRVQLHNLSTLIVHARVACNLKIYGQPVSAGSLYDGTDIWLLYPQQFNQGWFDIESVLQKKGKNIATMIYECTPENRKQQLTMLLELEFWDEFDKRRKLPSRPYYFDFNRWLWIPQLKDSSEV